MTLAVAVVTPQLAFVGADRRYTGVPALRDFQASKICSLETTDAHGLITCAGVGARARSAPFELSDWITHVLRGARRTLDQSLLAIAAAAGEQGLHRFVHGHAFAFAGFKSGSISLQTIASRGDWISKPLSGKATPLNIPPSNAPFRVINFSVDPPQQMKAILLGSGTSHVPAQALLDLSRHAKHSKTKEDAARRWAGLWAHMNRTVARKEATVGPEAMCAWRYREGGGEHISFASDGTRERNSGRIPDIAMGLPVGEIGARLHAHMMERLKNNPTNLVSEMNLLASEMNQEVLDQLLEGVSTTSNTKF